MQYLSCVKERIIYFIDCKGISKYKFHKDSGITRGILDRETGITEDNIAKFIAYAPDVNTEWLLTGKGNMLKEEKRRAVEEERRSGAPEQAAAYHRVKVKKYKVPDAEPGEVSTEKGIPLIPVDAMAGWGTGDVQIMNYETQRYVIPEFAESKADFMIEVKGDSMYPTYISGDIVACKQLPLDTFFQWNKVYVLDTVQGAMVKRIGESELENHIKCISDNVDYRPFDLNLQEVRALSIALGIIRFIN